MRGKFKALSKKGSLKLAKKLLLILLGIGILCIFLFTGFNTDIAWAKYTPKKSSNAKQTETRDTVADEKPQEIFLGVKEGFKPLDSIQKLEIKEKKNNLVFKMEGKKTVELQLHLEKDKNTIEDGFTFSPTKTVILTETNPQDSLWLNILSDSLFEKKVNEIELVISAKNTKELCRIPLTFIPKKNILRSKIYFSYDGNELGVISTLPYNTDKWKMIQINNNTGEDVLVSYQIAKISSKKVFLNDGTFKAAKVNKIPWGEKTPGIGSVTIKFNIKSEDDKLDTTFVMNTSAPPIEIGAGDFFRDHWLLVSLILLILGLGCFIYYLWGKNIDLSENFNSVERLIKVKEEEINKLKVAKSGQVIGGRDLGSEQQQEQGTSVESKLVPWGTPEVKKPSYVPWERYERTHNALNEARNKLENRMIDLSSAQSKIRQLELQRSDLTSQKTRLEQDLASKKDIIVQNEDKIASLDTKILKLEDDTSKLNEHIEKLKASKSALEKKYPEEMDKFLKDFIEQLDKTSR